MVDETRHEQISAAIDGEAPMPPELTASEREFVEAALRVRRRLRITEAGRPPDVTDVVLRRLPRDRRRARRRVPLAAAAAFIVAALAGVLAVRPGGPVAPRPASAELSGQVIEGQRAVGSFAARVTVTERNVHPDIAERQLSGTLDYDAPERLWLRLEQDEPRDGSWPANDIELVLAGGTAWVDALDDCPVSAQPGCLRSSRRIVEDLPPFSPTWISPLDLIVPTDAFLPMVDTPASEDGDTVTIHTTAARVDRLIDGLTSAGAIRSVHATDIVRLDLDAETLTLRRLSVEVADNLARATWAATNGYPDRAGTVVLDVEVTPIDAVPGGPPRRPAVEPVSAGFVERELSPSWPAPAGFVLGRTGVLEDGGPQTEVYTYSDGRAWLRIDVTEEWDEPRLFGSLGPLVRPVPVGGGVGYVDPAGNRLSLRGADRDVLVTGSVDLEVLVLAGSEVLRGIPIEEHWPQAAHVEDLPDGALVPPGDHLAVLDGGDLVVAVGGPGATGLVLRQAPAVDLPPPAKGDVVETVVRGVSARYAPRLGTLTWLEDGWRREVRGEGLDLVDLRDVADALVSP